VRAILARLKSDSRNLLTTCLEVAGLAVIVCGISRVSLTIAIISAGCALILLGALSA
jgi:hypothetical protein